MTGFDGINVQHGRLDAGSQDVMTAAKDIQTPTRPARGRPQAARLDWTGAAKQAYDEAKAKWDQAIADMIVLLQQASANGRPPTTSTRPPTRAAPTASDRPRSRTSTRGRSPLRATGLGRLRAAIRLCRLLPDRGAHDSEVTHGDHGDAPRSTCTDHGGAQHESGARRSRPVWCGSPSPPGPAGSTWCCPAPCPWPSSCPSWRAASGCSTPPRSTAATASSPTRAAQLANDAGLTLQGVEDGGLLTVTAGIDDEAPPRLRRRRRGDDRRRRARPGALGAGVRAPYRPRRRRPAAGARRGRAPHPGRHPARRRSPPRVVAGAARGRRRSCSRAPSTSPRPAVAVSLIAARTPPSRGCCSRPDERPVTWPLADSSSAPRWPAPAAARWWPAWSAWSASGGPHAGDPGRRRRRDLPGHGLLLAGGRRASAACVSRSLLTLVVLAGSVFPWLALGVTGTRVDQLYSPPDITADPDEIDPAGSARDARVAHEILVAISATVGAAAGADRAAGGGPRRLRHPARRRLLPGRDAADPPVPHRHRGARRPGVRHPRAGLGRRLAAGLIHDDWRPAPPSCWPAPAPSCSRSRCVPAPPSVRRGRLGDVAETVALLSLLPLLVLAAGFFATVVKG